MLGNSLTELARRTGRSGDEHARQPQGRRHYAQHAQKRLFLIAERQLVKADKRPKFRFAQDFYAFHGVNRQTFFTCYNRHLLSGGDDSALLPAKRGPRWRARRTLPFIEQLVLAQRSKGNNRYDIFAILKPTLRFIGATPPDNAALPRYDPLAWPSLAFEPLDAARYSCFTLATEAGRKGRTYPATLSAADEVAVHLFLDGRIAFGDIPRVVESALDRHEPFDASSVEAVLGADEWARRHALASLPS